MAAYIALFNSTVHMVMYSYYFFSSFKSKSIQKITVRVKPFITIIQLVQFVIIIAHCTVAILPSCNGSYFFDVQIFNFIVLFYLFGQFYLQTYMKTNKKGEVV